VPAAAALPAVHRPRRRPPIARGGQSARVAIPAARGGGSAPTSGLRARVDRRADAVATAEEAPSASSGQRVPRWLFQLVGLLALAELLFLTRFAYRRRAAGRSRGRLPGTGAIVVSPGVKEGSLGRRRAKRRWRKALRR
jgi:hypothetical protein